MKIILKDSRTYNIEDFFGKILVSTTDKNLIDDSFRYEGDILFKDMYWKEVSPEWIKNAEDIYDKHFYVEKKELEKIAGEKELFVNGFDGEKIKLVISGYPIPGWKVEERAVNSKMIDWQSFDSYFEEIQHYEYNDEEKAIVETNKEKIELTKEEFREEYRKYYNTKFN